MMKILAISWLGIAAVVGYFLPTPMLPDDFHQIRYLDAAITVFLLVFVWGAFHLAVPEHHSKRWVIIRNTAIPAMWLLLVLALIFFFQHVSRDYWETLWKRMEL